MEVWEVLHFGGRVTVEAKEPAQEEVMTTHRTYRPWLSLDVDEALRLWREGWTRARIARHLRRTEASVKGLIQMCGAYRYHKDGFSRHAKTVRRLNAEGWSDHEIARKVGVSVTSVRRWRNKLGLPAVGMKSGPKWQERHRRFLKAQHVESLAELRHDKARVKAAQEAKRAGRDCA